ncbi:hypothetical protein KZX06_08415 [Micrococcus sp. EYE_162]|uniref:hypothetical protein n=1 Tax=unclassified Micrococcus TaxID=2620948 RepID=UPI002006331D|nr:MULTISPECIES: hypothetical protein [unclassified Micrococcus]MCK6095959.1 hypothetical protein [Micrococcus sp. EYE_212]MCK6172050.1 hypothetical protein [Micrococcus sp. EYE_162]
MSAPAAPRRRPSLARRALVTATGVLVLGGLGAGAWWASEAGHGPLLGPEVCLVITDDGAHHRLSPDRAAVAGVIAATAQERGLPPRAATIGIATGIQESGLRALDHGDRAGPDSRGVFQQRPSQGWGTQEEVMDPVYAANAFFAALEDIAPDYQDMAVTEAAQAVQRSAYPDAYADHEVEARAWAAALTGEWTEKLRCRLDTPGDADPEGFLAAAARQHPSVAWSRPPEDSPSGRTVAVAGGTGGLDDAEARSLAAWSVVNADAHGVRTVETGDLVWERSGGGGFVSRAEAGIDQTPVEGVRVTF